MWRTVPNRLEIVKGVPWHCSGLSCASASQSCSDFQPIQTIGPGAPRFITLRVSPNRGNTQNAHPLGYWRCLYGVGMIQIDVLHHPVSTIGMPSTLRQIVIEFRPKICPCRRFGRFFDQNVVCVESIANISPMVIAGK